MNNYQYIIASVGEMRRESKFSKETVDSLIQQIRELLSPKELATVDFVLKAGEKGSLTEEFYTEAMGSRQMKIVREYFKFDLEVRNAKVRYLNEKLGRAAEQDVLSLKKEAFSTAIFFEVTPDEFPEAAAVEAALRQEDILKRESAIDSLYWDKISEISTFENFSLTAIIAFILKLKIAARWAALDEETGRRIFRSLVNEIRSTFDAKNKTIE